MHPIYINIQNMISGIFNRYLSICFLLGVIFLAESCRSSHQSIKTSTMEENTSFENLDDTTTVLTSTVVVSIPTQGGGTKTTTNEKKRIIKHKSKKATSHNQVSKDEQKIDEITPVLEREKTKRIKSENKKEVKVAKEERKGKKYVTLDSLTKRLVLYFLVATILYFWIKRK